MMDSYRLTRRGLLALALPFHGLRAQAKALNLKITGLKTITVNAGSANWVFAKVAANQGLTGLGEGSVTSKEATLAQAIMEHERFLLGKDPAVLNCCGRRCSGIHGGGVVLF